MKKAAVGKGALYFVAESVDYVSMKWICSAFVFLSILIAPVKGEAWNEDQAREALKKAVGYFCDEVAVEGGYVWRVSEDLTRREGEGKVGGTTIWVQPPGTPAVGLALLEVWELSGEEAALRGAVEAAKALAKGQLATGGWNSRIELAKEDRVRWVYRGSEPHSRRARNTSVLDDNTTQAALTFLMRLDEASAFKMGWLHEMIEVALKAVLNAQYTSGAFPQVFDGSADRTACADRPARFPASWSRVYEGHQQYWYRPTLNDNVMADVIAMLFLAARVYDDPVYAEAARRAGEFLLKAQLPEPQPGWAQQYNYEMEPIWARKFEPAAITGSESRDVLKALLLLHDKTGEVRWLEPIPRALAYYRSLLLSDGRLARFYEIGSDRPLYFDREYTLTYDDSDMPTHYSFKVSDWTDGIEWAYEKAKRGERAGQKRAKPDLSVLKSLDAKGRWVEDGYVESATFNRNIVALAAAVEKE